MYIRLEEFKYLDIYILSREDIIVSKIIRMDPKDIEDIDNLMIESDKKLIMTTICEVLERTDLFQTKKDAFTRNLSLFKERYNV
ncbi:MAG TPA: DUF6036 family nucleotidyltransferase [Pseudobacteroides sp.]|uniref:DUF6036 family nucleotidyltransferase n=1 Tax=Pseudobacteroides sp. TaxID=1968840 RepID=UPI002F935255